VRIRGAAIPTLGGLEDAEEVDWRELVRKDASPDIQRLAFLRADE